jgi:hypothetical protein
VISSGWKPSDAVVSSRWKNFGDKIPIAGNHRRGSFPVTGSSRIGMRNAALELP